MTAGDLRVPKKSRKIAHPEEEDSVRMAGSLTSRYWRIAGWEKTVSVSRRNP